MDRYFLFALLGMAITIFALPATAADPQETDSAAVVSASSESDTDVDTEAASDSEGPRHFDADHRQRIYESSRLEPRRAILYSLALPGLGNYYAEQYALGTISMMSMVFTGIFVAFGLLNNHSDLVRIGAGLGAVTYIGSATAAYLGVRSHNDQLRRSLHIDARRDAPFSSLDSPQNWTIGWRFEF